MQELYEENTAHLERLWTVDQAAEYFGLKKMTIYKWIGKGKIKSVKIGSRVRIPRSEIERIAGGAKENLQAQTENES